MKASKKLFSIFAFLFLLSLASAQMAHAYHIWMTNGKTARAEWTDADFLTDNTGLTLPGSTRAGSDGTAQATAPNNDSVGLLYIIDRQVNFTDPPAAGITRYCDGNPAADANAYFPLAAPDDVPYTDIYNALGIWSSITNSVTNLAYVCSVNNMGANSVDNVNDADPTIDLAFVNGSNTTFVLNGFNEILLDDTNTFAYGNAVLGGGLPVGSVLGLGFALDADGDPIPLDDDATPTTPITEAFIILNMSQNRPDYVIPSVLVHEIGHTMGLGHTGSVMNARSTSFNSGVAGGPTTPDDSRIPTMFSFDTGLGDTLEIDDLGAILSNYSAGPIATLGRISGQVLNSEGTPMLGAGVVAYATADNGDLVTPLFMGDEIGTVVGGHPALGENGNYRIDNVPPGTYRVALIPLSGAGASASIHSSQDIDPIFPDNAFTFTTSFYTTTVPTTIEADASVITVTAGAETFDINFIDIESSTSGNNPNPSNGGGINFANTGSSSGGCSMLPTTSASALSALSYFLVLFYPLLLISWKKHRS